MTLPITTEAAARAQTAATASDPSLAQGGDTSNPANPHAGYVISRPWWQMCLDLVTPDAVTNAGDTYLPQYAPAETDDGYAIRLKLTKPYNATERTIEAYTGLVMNPPPKLGEDVPQVLVDLAENIDNRGTHLNVFASQLLSDGLTVGLNGFLVDYARIDNPGALSFADEQALGLRPYWVLFSRPDIIRVRFQVRNGVVVVSLLVLRERTEVDDGEFGSKPISRYRVFRNIASTIPGADPAITVQVYETQPGDPDGRAASTGNPSVMRNQVTIPFVPFITGKDLGQWCVIPPVYWFAVLNIEHYRWSSEHANLARLCNVPTPVRKGYTAPTDPTTGQPVSAPVLIGPENVMDVPENGDFFWRSADPAPLDHDLVVLDRIESRMGKIGAAFMSPDSGPSETAEAKRIDSAAQNAKLGTIATRLQDALEQGLLLTARYLGLGDDAGGSVTVNTDFEGTVADPQLLAVLNAMATAGNLSLETFLGILERYKILGDGFDVDAEIARLTGGARAPLMFPRIGATGGAPAANGGAQPPATSGADQTGDTGEQPAAGPAAQ